MAKTMKINSRTQELWPTEMLDVEGPGRNQRRAVIVCQECGAKKTISSSVTAGAADHSKILSKIFRQNFGWEVVTLGVGVCLDCQNKAKEVKKMMTPKVSLVAPATKKPAPAPAPVPAPEIVAAKSLPHADIPREPTRAEIRMIVDEIERNYPKPEKGYVGGATDKTVAAALKMPWGWIARERERQFGPERIVDEAALRAGIADAKRALSEFESMALKRLDELACSIAELECKLGKEAA